MDDSKISMVISKCNITSDKNDNIINEETDKDKFIPDGINVAYVKSNFCELYHENYKHLSKLFKTNATKKTSNKGRKPKPKVEKKKKCENGIANEFCSSITFGVIYDAHIYEVRVFRKKSIGISGLNNNNREYIRNIIVTLLNYINSIDPDLNLRIIDDPEIILCNTSAAYNYIKGIGKPNTVKAFNLYLLKRLHDNEYNDNAYWGCDNKVIIYNNNKAYFTMALLYGDKKYNLKFYSNGKLNIYGGNDRDNCNEITKKFFAILEKHKDILVQDSIGSRRKTDII